MVYPGRPVLELLPQFRDTAGRRQTPQQRAALLAFVREQYLAGRSLRELGELTGRTQSVLCTCQGSVVRDPRRLAKASSLSRYGIPHWHASRADRPPRTPRDWAAAP